MRYHNITKDDMLNGDGLRVVLWVSGCTHACPGCHNPVTWELCGGLPFDEEEKKEIFKELDKDYISGITLSGGDPLHPANRGDVEKLVKEIKVLYPKKTIWCYTGFSWEDVSHLPFMKDIDVLVDGRFIKEEFDPALLWKGSKNQKVIDVKASLLQHEVVLKYN